MLIRAIPSAGKSHLANLDRKITDVDALIESFGFKGHFDDLLKSKSAGAFFDACRKADEEGTLLVHFEPTSFRLREPDLRVAYKPDDYIKHIRWCGRLDLIDKFGEDVLRSWASDYEAFDNVRWLKYNEYVSNAIV